MKAGKEFKASRIIRTVSALAFAAMSSLSAHAAVLTSSGTLADEPVGAYKLYNFQVTSAGTVELRLSSTTDAYLGLFSGTNVLSNATYIGEDDDAGGGLNSYLSLSLDVGNYTAWITTHGSFWNFNTNSISTNHDHTPTNYTLEVTGDVAAVASDVPEPASMALLGLGLAGFAAARRRTG
jgi:hypothetical protein